MELAQRQPLQNEYVLVRLRDGEYELACYAEYKSSKRVWLPKHDNREILASDKDVWHKLEFIENALCLYKRLGRGEDQ